MAAAGASGRRRTIFIKSRWRLFFYLSSCNLYVNRDEKFGQHGAHPTRCTVARLAPPPANQSSDRGRMMVSCGSLRLILLSVRARGRQDDDLIATTYTSSTATATATASSMASSRRSAMCHTVCVWGRPAARTVCERCGDSAAQLLILCVHSTRRRRRRRRRRGRVGSSVGSRQSLVAHLPRQMTQSRG